jgi:hypothetical protein
MKNKDQILLENLYETIIPTDNKIQHPPLDRFDRERYPHAELVPVSYLNQIKEFNRGDMFSSWEFKNFDEMETEIFKNGMKHPLFVEYSVPDKKVLLGEGNHRLFLANKLNIKYLPVLVNRKISSFIGQQKLKAKEVSGWSADENVHIPSTMSPSEVGIPSIPLP